MNTKFYSSVIKCTVKGHVFDQKEAEGRQENAAPSIRAIIQKFQVGIPIGQYVRHVEYGNYLDPTARPDFTFDKAYALQELRKREEGLRSKAADRAAVSTEESSSSQDSPSPESTIDNKA